MQWNEGKNGGFSSGDPWIKTNEDLDKNNVAASNETIEMLNKLITLKQNEVYL